MVVHKKNNKDRICLLCEEIRRSPEYTTSASVSADYAFDNVGVGTRHRLRGRDSVGRLERERE